MKRLWFYEFGEVDLRAKIKVRDIKPSAPGFIGNNRGPHYL